MTRIWAGTNGEDWSNIAANISQTSWTTVVSGAADGASAFPDNLTEVAPVLEIGEVGVDYRAIVSARRHFSR